MSLLKNAELFAKTKHSGKLKKSGITYSKHLEDVVSRLKSLGVNDEEVLCTGWLHDILEDTDTSFDELFEKFGRRVAVLTLSLTKNNFHLVHLGNKLDECHLFDEIEFLLETMVYLHCLNEYVESVQLIQLANY